MGDSRRPHDLASEAVKLISTYYPEGALEWLTNNRPDIIKYLKQAEEAVNTAILTDDGAFFPRALETYVKGHIKAFKVFTDRQSGSPEQADLFPRTPAVYPA